MASDAMMCGSECIAWDIICGFAQSKTVTLMFWIEGCKCSNGPIGKIWDYVDDDGELNREIPPPQYHPGKPHNPNNHTRWPGPYAKWLRPDRPVKRPRRVTVPDPVTVPDDGDPWGWE